MGPAYVRGGRAVAVTAARSTERAVSDNPTEALHNTTEIEMLEAKKRWNEYRLADGTTLRLKPVMTAVFRATVNTHRMANRYTT
jgi:hypothetical protein